MSPASQIVLSVLLMQFLITVLAMAISVGLQGFDAALAAGFGGLTGIILTAYFALRIFAKLVKVADGYAVSGLGLTQLSKYMLIFALFYLGLITWQLEALPMVVTFMFSQGAYWLVLIIKHDR